ncbi:hypothetical protein GY45DRAFT_1316521 [Cubamyces sp. BRFM 1775]|nr:hypothetical protein GY45DRAFT_1316521 [Cubamyces sp. BRFM 1775]
MGENPGEQSITFEQDLNIAPTQSGRLRGLDSLPHELIKFVFAYTSYHKATIAACTLVSRSWRTLSIPHLFSSLTVVRRGSFADFDDFLDKHPHIASCIRQLDLKHAVSPRVAVTHATLARLLAKLPGLQVLRLRRLWLLDPGFDSPTNSTTSRPSLKALTLNECFSSRNSLLSLGALHSILDTFPADSISLRYLTVTATPESTSGPDVQTQQNELNADTLTVQHVHVRYLWSIHVLRRALASKRSHLRPVRARSADLHTQNPGSLHVLNEFLHCVGGEQLRQLDFPLIMGPQICPLENKPGYGCVLHLNACCNPESFTFQIHAPLPRTVSDPTAHRTEGHYIQNVPLSRVLITYLPHLPSTIRTYTLRFLDAHSPAHTKNQKIMDLGKLDDILLGRFPLLASVRVILPDTTSMKKYSQAVIQAMPKCGQRRLVSVIEWDETQDLNDW